MKNTMMKLSLTCAWLLLGCFNSVMCQKARTRERNNEQSGPISRIVGGKPASVGQWPWQAAVLLLNSSFSTFSFCGGTLIGPRLVVSAAHCFTSNKLYAIRVVFGEGDLTTTSETRQSHYVRRFINHPSYLPSNVTADISLLELRTTVTYNVYVRPAILPNSTTSVTSDLSCVVSGYGETNGTGETFELNYAQVDIIPLDTCQSWYSSFIVPITENHICAGNESGGVDSCQGDSGGPLVCRQSPTGSDGYFLLGVTSFGDGCAKPRRPGVYTNVISYLDWIMQYNVTSTTFAPISQKTTQGSSPTTVTSTIASPIPQHTTDGSSPTSATSTTPAPTSQHTTDGSATTSATFTSPTPISQKTTDGLSPTTATSTTPTPVSQHTTDDSSPTTATSTIASPSPQQATSGSETRIARSYFVIPALALLQHLVHMLY